MLRTRDKSRVDIIEGQESDFDADGTLSWGPRSTSSSVVSTDVMVDVVTKGFKRSSAKGGIINSPMTKHVENCIVHSVQGTFQQTSGKRYTWTGQWRARGSFDPTQHSKVLEKIEQLESLAITEAFANVGKPDVAVLTELAELRETLSFLASPVKQMVKLTKRFSQYLDTVKSIYERDAIRRAKWEKLPVHIKAKRTPPPPPKLPTFNVGRWKGTDVSSAWLAFRYGLMPLIYTFQDVEKLLKKRLEGSPLRATARSKEEENVDLTSEEVAQWGWGTLVYQHTDKVLGSCKVTARAGVLYEVDATLLTQIGVRWNRVPMALYEAIPLSFVSDWFHNGASVYDALTAEARSGKILAAWSVAKVEFDLAFVQQFGPAISGGSASGTVSETRSGKWQRRTPASAADVRFKLRIDLSSKRIADGLALIHTFLSTGGKRK